MFKEVYAIFRRHFFKLFLPILKSIGIWRYSQKINRTKLCDLVSESARDYSGAPKQVEDSYATLIVLFKYPLIRKDDEITVHYPEIYWVGRIRNLHEKCTDIFTIEQNRVIESILEVAKRIKNDKNKINLKSENIEEQKNIARQVLVDWRYVLFMLTKIGYNREKFKPLNNDPEDFNNVIRERFGVSLDENKLFESGLSKYGVKIPVGGHPSVLVPRNW